MNQAHQLSTVNASKNRQSRNDSITNISTAKSYSHIEFSENGPIAQKLFQYVTLYVFKYFMSKVYIINVCLRMPFL